MHGAGDVEGPLHADQIQQRGADERSDEDGQVGEDGIERGEAGTLFRQGRLE